jgi:hypothetical protein
LCLLSAIALGGAAAASALASAAAEDEPDLSFDCGDPPNVQYTPSYCNSCLEQQMAYCEAQSDPDVKRLCLRNADRFYQHCLFLITGPGFPAATEPPSRGESAPGEEDGDDANMRNNDRAQAGGIPGVLPPIAVPPADVRGEVSVVVQLPERVDAEAGDVRVSIAQSDFGVEGRTLTDVDAAVTIDETGELTVRIDLSRHPVSDDAVIGIAILVVDEMGQARWGRVAAVDLYDSFDLDGDGAFTFHDRAIAVDRFAAGEMTAERLEAILDLRAK